MEKGIHHVAKFPCGRRVSALEGAVVNLPRNMSCDSCVIQMIWETKVAGKMYMCADIEITNGLSAKDDCSGQCMNGGQCLNGHCICRKGFEGDYCNVVEYVPDKTNYTKMLKYLLLFIIMVLIIIGLIFVAHLLFTRADDIRQRMSEMFPRPRPAPVEEPVVVHEQDADDISGRGFGKVDSAYGNNLDINN